MNLPEKYIAAMKEFLGEDYPAWQDSFLTLPEAGIRVNELKTDPASFVRLWKEAGTAFHADEEPLETVEWIHNGFHIKNKSVFSGHPYYQAGLYYIQEPSAMTPAEILPVRPGDRVLDLCAAPGGKTTELLAKLRGRGILYANDISASRALSLRKNIELAGAVNAFVTAEDPRKLEAAMPCYFDRILVDAPCSGEGMFRRQPDMVRDWIEKGPDYYADIQYDILTSAVHMLRPGGYLVYSTCTFSEIENEGNVLRILEDNPDMETAEIPEYAGYMRSRKPALAACCIRVMPHRMRGEGQFVALLRKKGPEESGNRNPATGGKPQIYVANDQLYLLPEGHKPIPGLRYILTGLHAGTVKSRKIQPTQALAQALSAETWPRILNLDAKDERIMRYLRGESISFFEDELMVKDGGIAQLFGIDLAEFSVSKPQNKAAGRAGRMKKGGRKVSGRKSADSSVGRLDSCDCELNTGDILVLADGFPVGFGSDNRGLLKNKRNPGWRL